MGYLQPLVTAWEGWGVPAAQLLQRSPHITQMLPPTVPSSAWPKLCSPDPPPLQPSAALSPFCGLLTSSPCVLGSLSAASEIGDLQQPPRHPPPLGHPPNHQPVCNYDRHPILKNLPWLCVYFGLKSSAWNISSWMSFALAHLPSSFKKYPPSPSPLTVCSLGKQRRASPWKCPTPFQNWFILSALYTGCLGPVKSRACKSLRSGKYRCIRLYMWKENKSKWINI